PPAPTATSSDVDVQRDVGYRSSRFTRCCTMASATASERHNSTKLPDAHTDLALAIADVGWFNTENLFREIDRENVSVLLLKCQDYVNGWRRGLYPWSRSCRLRKSGPSSFDQQLVLPTGWMKRYPRLGMQPVAHAIRKWWASRPKASRRGLVMSYPHY